MEIIKCKDYFEMSSVAFEKIKKEILAKPNIVLGLATGSTPIGLYKQMVEANKKGEISFKDVKTINLDEYVGLLPTNENSYRYFMNENLFDHIDIKKENTFVPNGLAESEKECLDYEKLIDKFGVDVQILGIGLNGHIGFNEPDDHFEKFTHIVDLKASTIQANSRFFDDIKNVPTKAITMGIKSIFKAKKIILLCSGKAKLDILKSSIYGEITPLIPASILQLHNDCTVIYTENNK